MDIRKRNRNRGYVALGALLAAGLTVVPIVATSALSAAPAGALSTTHKATLSGNTGLAVEPSKAKVTFFCNSVSRTFGWGIKDVQVIGSDGLTPWDTGSYPGYNPLPGQFYLVFGDAHGHDAGVSIYQDPTTALYGSGGALPLPAGFGCATGDPIIVFGGSIADLEAGRGSLAFVSTLN